MHVLEIDWSAFYKISYQSKLGKSLKNTLRKFDKAELFGELNDVISYYNENQNLIPYEYRIKALQSCQLKYEKNFPSTEVERVYNDILGVRMEVQSYSVIDKLDLPKEVRLVDMRLGKAKDDGYRGIHMYFQKDHACYPIEIQLMTPSDRQFNEWLHIFLYKYVKDDSIGCKLRELYDSGIIQTVDDFRKELQKLCAI